MKQVLAYLATKKKKRKRSDNTWVLTSVSDIKKIQWCRQMGCTTCWSEYANFILPGNGYIHTSLQERAQKCQEGRTHWWARGWSEGGVNLSIMNSSWDLLKNKILSRLGSLTITTKGLSQLNAPAVEPVVRAPGRSEFDYKERTWCVPMSFEFLTGCRRLNGWRKWLRGSILSWERMRGLSSPTVVWLAMICTHNSSETPSS